MPFCEILLENYALCMEQDIVLQLIDQEGERLQKH